MFFQPDTPPDTQAYLIFGYVAFFVVLAVYLWWLGRRQAETASQLGRLRRVKPDSE